MDSGNENVLKAAFRVFWWRILVSTLAASVIGGLFGVAIAVISPEFVEHLFPQAEDCLRYACAVGMILGVFIGLGASCVACALSVIVQVFRVRVEHKS